MSIQRDIHVTIANQNQQRISSFMSVDDLLISSKTAIEGLYVHIPFCFHKCHYCDFYSIVDQDDRQQAFVERLIEEIAAFGGLNNSPLKTIFFGGGTPTLLTPHLWFQLLEELHKHVQISAEAELTVEANPETITGELVRVLVDGGINRASIGAQSFNPKHLKTLERWHEPENVKRSVERFRKGGIVNINLDMISAIPGQTLSEWHKDIEMAVSLNPTHLSCYTLMYEDNTPLTVKLRQGVIQRLDSDIEAEMYESTIEHLQNAGFKQYEISNWSKPDYECRHNLLYWKNKNWWPVGPGAVGHVDGVRWKNVPRISEYLASETWPPITDVEELEHDQRVGEILMLGLRILEGIPLEDLEELLELDRIDRNNVIASHIDSGLLEKTASHLRLTKRGLLLADSVFTDLLSV